ncbi:MAG: hypothetical protein D6795_00800 [Deltaproteobacteria bacterium]|nr:MAG: hypothetical protein D6795_00800 [Deltaproteobacteria bacterium]
MKSFLIATIPSIWRFGGVLLSRASALEGRDPSGEASDFAGGSIGNPMNAAGRNDPFLLPRLSPSSAFPLLGFPPPRLSPSSALGFRDDRRRG